jgi:hypothetical protein
VTPTIAAERNLARRFKPTSNAITANAGPYRVCSALFVKIAVANATAAQSILLSAPVLLRAYNRRLSEVQPGDYPPTV